MTWTFTCNYKNDPQIKALQTDKHLMPYNIKIGVTLTTGYTHCNPVKSSSGRLMASSIQVGYPNQQLHIHFNDMAVSHVNVSA